MSQPNKGSSEWYRQMAAKINETIQPVVAEQNRLWRKLTGCVILVNPRYAHKHNIPVALRHAPFVIMRELPQNRFYIQGIDQKRYEVPKSIVHFISTAR